MRYVLLVHSHPQPWGHPTSEFLAEHRALPEEERERLNRLFDEQLALLQESGELVGGEALGAPGAARLYRWSDGDPQVTDGPYSEREEHLAGFFLVDVESHARAEEIATSFAGPGETVELRPTMRP